MPWHVELAAHAERDIDNLDRAPQRRVLRYLADRLALAEDPRVLGAPLHGPLGGLWRFRVGDLRILAELAAEDRRVLVLRVAHRREAYR